MSATTKGVSVHPASLQIHIQILYFDTETLSQLGFDNDYFILKHPPTSRLGYRPTLPHLLIMDSLQPRPTPQDPPYRLLLAIIFQHNPSPRRPHDQSLRALLSRLGEAMDWGVQERMHTSHLGSMARMQGGVCMDALARIRTV